MKFSKEQWQVIIKEQKESGLSKSKFCKSKNISPTTFHSVLSRIDSHANKSLFTKVKLEPRAFPDSTQLRITFPQGIFIEFPISSLNEVIGAMNRGSL